MATNKSNSGFYVSVTCPGCGAGLTIDTDFFVLTCKYCESVLRIKMPDLPPAWLVPAKVQLREVRFAIDRHLKELGCHLTDSNLQFKRIYFPYWKIDALLLKVRNKTHDRLVQVQSEDTPEVVCQIDKTEIGISPYSVTVAAGNSLPSMPESLGVRSQTITALPFTKENHQEDFQAIEPDRPWSEIWPRVVHAVMSVGDFDSPSFGRNRTDMLYPDYSLLYFPFFLVDSYAGADYLRFIIDGVSCRVVDCYDPVSGETEKESGPSIGFSKNAASTLNVLFEKGTGGTVSCRTGKSNDIRIDGGEEMVDESKIEFGDLSIELHRCDTCGADLPDSRSPLYICPNCHEMKAVVPIDFSLESTLICRSELSAKDQLLPFWRMKLDPKYSARLRFIFGGMFTSDSIVVPAFSGPNYDALIRLARKMTFGHSRLKFEPFDGSPRNLTPIEVSPVEAVKYLNLLTYRERLVKTPGGKVEKEEYRPVSAGIIYAPFRLENYFYVDTILESITFEKQLLH